MHMCVESRHVSGIERDGVFRNEAFASKYFDECLVTKVFNCKLKDWQFILPSDYFRNATSKSNTKMG